jgi:hypothetical protein
MPLASALVAYNTIRKISKAFFLLELLLKPLQKAKVSVVYMYAFIGFSSGRAVMVFHFSDNDKAIEVLLKRGIKPIDAEAFGMLE